MDSLEKKLLMLVRRESDSICDEARLILRDCRCEETEYLLERVSQIKKVLDNYFEKTESDLGVVKIPEKDQGKDS